MTDKEFKVASQKLIDTCKKYNFMERKIQPYSFVMTVEKLVNGWKDYNRCTYSSKLIMQDEYEGLADTVKYWVEVENEPIVKVLVLTGKHKGEIKQYHESVARDLVDCEWAKFID